MKSLKSLQLWMMIAGVLIAVVIAVTQLFYFEANNLAKAKQETEQQNSQASGDESYISLPSSYSIPSSAHVVLSQEFSFIEEFIFNNSTKESEPVELKLSSGKLFKALFHCIISPNAP